MARSSAKNAPMLSALAQVGPSSTSSLSSVMSKVKERSAGDDLAPTGNSHPPKGEGKDREVEFMCRVVPLPTILDQLGISQVNLLKVDVEGDELAVLQGVPASLWPHVHQVVVEVHDIDGRLDKVTKVLKERAGFSTVCCEAQRTSGVQGYVMVVPEALNMWYVYARR
ncbi:unnamed protein product [Discosporangium mesarthrocarpum]